jgi:hypothetical protein
LANVIPHYRTLPELRTLKNILRFQTGIAKIVAGRLARPHEPGEGLFPPAGGHSETLAGCEAGTMTESEFWRDIEARFRAIQSKKVPIHVRPLEDYKSY